MTIDAPDTAALRGTVLAAWTASPARFREDANAEEELVRGAYRDRLIVELAQNAADAAVRADVPGRLSLRLDTTVDGSTLIAANTGAPLDAAGVESLSTLRASTKRDDATVGRFGVGFASVLTVTDAPQVRSRGGSVGWSAEFTRTAVAGVPDLVAEVARRSGGVPVLRLPFDVPESPPDGWDTAVVLPLRDAAAVDRVRRLLAEVDDVLLLALPGLVSVEIRTPEGRRELTAARAGSLVTVTADGPATRWRMLTRVGELPAEARAERPVEEPGGWRVTWALPMADGRPAALPGTVRPVLHAPTPTDDRLDLPALLFGSFPVDSSRRRVAPGRARDFLLDVAAQAYVDLLAEVAAEAGPAAAALVPGPVAAGEVDAVLRRAVLERLGDRAFLPAADGLPLRPRDATALADATPDLVAVLSPVLGGLLPPGWPAGALNRLGVRRLSLAEVADELAGCDRDPRWWQSFYAAVDGDDREALRGLPVPLADGRLVRGPRDVLLPGEVDAESLTALGLRVAHPDAVHPLLERLGARPATAEAVVDHPAVRGLVAGLRDGYPEEQASVAEALLSLVAAAPWAARPWLAELPLPDADGEPTPAGELLLPGGALLDVLETDALGVVDQKLFERFGAQALRAVGVLDSFALVRDTDLPADPEFADHDLDGEDRWLAAVARAAGGGVGPAVIVDFVAVRDLDLVDPRRWDAALRLLAGPDLRSAVTEPAPVRRFDGRVAQLPSYTAWWLSEHPVLGGRRPRDLRLPDADPLLAGLWDLAPPGLDRYFAQALGVRVGLPELLAEPDGASELLARLADPLREVGRRQLAALYRALAVVPSERVAEQEFLRVPDGPGTRVVRADDVVVIDAPDLLALRDGIPLPMPAEVAEDLAEMLDLPLASERTPAPVVSLGRPVGVPDPVHRVLPAAPREYFEHDTLLVAGPGGPVEVDWRWVDGRLHVATTRGLGLGLAWAAGDWARRWVACAAVEEPRRLGEILDEDDLAGA